ncbi:MAG: ABC transporter permease [Planctomycetota bacterium]|nr:ABC transporter permease [Planctomycetota bacterium]
MRPVLLIAGRECAAFFRTSAGWVTIALYTLLSGLWIALSTLRPGEPATLRAFFGVSHWILLFVAPAISMRLIAEEKRSGTMEVLMTSPISDWQMVLGKYLGAVGFFLLMLSPSLVYVGLLEALADPEYGPIATGYAGVILVGMLYLSAGLFTSALTENQVVSLLSTIFFFVLLELGVTQGARLAGPPFDRAIYGFSVLLRAGDFAKGIIDTGHVVALLAGSAWFIVLSVAVVESRRWR